MTLFVRLPHAFGPRWSEWLGGISAVAAGLGLLHPYPAFLNNEAFSVFAWAPEWAWGYLLVTVGVLRIAGLIINGRRKKATSWIRYVTAFVSFMVYFGFSLGLAGSGVMSTWPGAWPVFALNEIVNMIRAAQDARIGYNGRPH